MVALTVTEKDSSCFILAAVFKHNVYLPAGCLIGIHEHKGLAINFVEDILDHLLDGFKFEAAVVSDNSF